MPIFKMAFRRKARSLPTPLREVQRHAAAASEGLRAGAPGGRRGSGVGTGAYAGGGSYRNSLDVANRRAYGARPLVGGMAPPSVSTG